MAKEMAVEVIAAKIILIRGKKVMMDKDLAELYGVPVKVLNQAVKRNISRFPTDFMFSLTWQEVMVSRSQFVTLKQGGNIKYLPYAFTEQGVAMLSSVLKSERAIQVNIAIMRAFVMLREFLMTHKELADKINVLEKQYSEHDKKFVVVFEAIRRLLDPGPLPEQTPKPQIGFK
jgi:hypothetical protein